MCEICHMEMCSWWNNHSLLFFVDTKTPYPTMNYMNYEYFGLYSSNLVPKSFRVDNIRIEDVFNDAL